LMGYPELALVFGKCLGSGSLRSAVFLIGTFP